MIFGIALMKILRVSLHSWLIIKLSLAFLGKTWLRKHWDYVLNVSINGASTTFGLASWSMQGLRGDIELSLNYWPPFYVIMVATTSLLCPKNERQWRINDFWPCIVEKTRVAWWDWPIIKLSAAYLGKDCSINIVTTSHNECQWSVNNVWLDILDNSMSMERR
jgi:hypothetical protein